MNNYLLILTIMVLWGMYPLFTHYFVRTLDPIFLVSVSTLISALPFMIKALFQKNLSRIFSGKILKKLFIMAIFGALGSVFLFVGTKLTTGVNTGLLLQIEPIYSLILGTIFFGEVIGKKKFTATLLMVLGAMVIIYKPGLSPNIGDIFIILTTLMFQISHTFAKKLMDKGEDISIILAGRQLYAGILLVIFALIFNKSFFELFGSVQSLVSASYLGLSLSIIVLLWYLAIKRMPLSTASSFLPLTALVALLGSALLLKETISTQQYIGFALIVTGMIWASKVKS